jgi:ribosomal protein S18 acetylase RimI-like enzyme
VEIELRKVKKSDIPFLMSLRKVTMNEYLEKSGFPTDEKSHLDRILYRFDAAHIVFFANEPIGLFKFYLEGSCWHVVQIQILPGYQEQGIGTKLLKNLQLQAFKKKQIVGLSVLKSNPAKILYQRIGFIVQAESVIDFTMQHKPNKTN